MRELLIKSIEEVFGEKGLLDDVDFNDTFESIGMSEDLFRELCYVLENELGVEEVGKVLKLTDSIHKAISKMEYEYE